MPGAGLCDKDVADPVRSEPAEKHNSGLDYAFTISSAASGDPGMPTQTVKAKPVPSCNTKPHFDAVCARFGWEVIK
jgi:hypothetical protein